MRLILPLLLLIAVAMSLLATPPPTTTKQQSGGLKPARSSLSSVPESEFLALVSSIQLSQTQYYTDTNKYFQGLTTHTVIPSSTAATTPDNAGDSPDDQDHSWHDVMPLPAVMPFALRIDTYASPEGDGYLVWGYTDISGDIWVRRFNVGPEAWRNADWYQE